MARPADPRRRRRAAAHTCPRCSRAWAVRGVRTAAGPWLFSCRYCSWCDLRGAVKPVPPRERSAGAHVVHLYRQDSELVRSLADYLSECWAAGGSAVVIATADHRAALRDELAARGLAEAGRSGRLVELDADETLALFMRDDVPDPVLFAESVGSLVRGHASPGPLWAFGEMVDLLWARGSALAALELEQLWGDLMDQLPFSLLCGYALAHLDEAGSRVVRSAHDHART